MHSPNEHQITFLLWYFINQGGVLFVADFSLCVQLLHSVVTFCLLTWIFQCWSYLLPVPTNTGTGEKHKTYCGHSYWRIVSVYWLPFLAYRILPFSKKKTSKCNRYEAQTKISSSVHNFVLAAIPSIPYPPVCCIETNGAWWWVH